MERRNEMGIIVTACAHIQHHSKEMVSLPYFYLILILISK